jgi:hypothetical protein
MVPSPEVSLAMKELDVFEGVYANGPFDKSLNEDGHSYN